jgi:hypothetical protein
LLSVLWNLSIGTDHLPGTLVKKKIKHKARAKQKGKTSQQSPRLHRKKFEQ